MLNQLRVLELYKNSVVGEKQRLKVAGVNSAL
jgi:hypothetical protein